MKHLKKISKALNNAFILIVLFIFYFPVIGIAFVFFKLFSRKNISAKNYWISPKVSVFDKQYFESPY